MLSSYRFINFYAEPGVFNLKGLVSLLEKQKWQKVKNIPEFEKTQFSYKYTGWKKERRFVAIRMAYNLMVWLMWLNDETGFKEEPQTIRMFLIHVPARLMYSGRQWFLRLSENYLFKERWQWIENSIHALSFG